MFIRPVITPLVGYWTPLTSRGVTQDAPKFLEVEVLEVWNYIRAEKRAA